MWKKLLGCLTILIIAFVILFLLVFFTQWNKIIRPSLATYDIRGTITDTDGNPLNDVYLDADCTMFMTMPPGYSYRQNVDSEFRIQGSELTRIELTFVKKGYYPETRSFSIDKLRLKENLQIRMRPSEQMGVSEFHKFQFDEKQKYICDLSDLDHGIIQAQTVDLETTPKTKHLEFDFRRDENGDIIFSEPESSYSAPMPAAFIIRLHSDDPDDGLIATSGSNVARTTARDVGRLFSGEPSEENDDRISPWTIPGTGYGKKEIVIESPPRDLDAAFFLKCDGRFGKGEMSRPFDSSLGFDRKGASYKFELDINKEKGDRKLRPGLKDNYIPRVYY